MNGFTVPTFQTFTTNASIDKVIFQIERLSGQINELSNNVDEAAGEVAQRGKQTFDSIKFNINNDTIVNFKHMVEVISSKTHNWPLTELIIAAICALIVLVVAVLYVMAKGGEKAATYRYQKRLIQV